MSLLKILGRATGMALIGVLAFASVASAASSPLSITATGHKMTVTVSGLKLVTRAAVDVDVAFVCDPLDENGTLVSNLFGLVRVQLTEAVGKQLATGSSEVEEASVICDSSSVNRYTVLVVSTTVPFKAGGTVIQSNVSASDENFCCSGDYYRYANVQGAIKIKR